VQRCDVAIVTLAVHPNVMLLNMVVSQHAKVEGRWMIKGKVIIPTQMCEFAGHISSRPLCVPGSLDERLYVMSC
jgi:hypothetical protein